MKMTNPEASPNEGRAYLMGRREGQSPGHSIQLILHSSRCETETNQQSWNETRGFNLATVQTRLHVSSIFVKRVYLAKVGRRRFFSC